MKQNQHQNKITPSQNQNYKQRQCLKSKVNCKCNACKYIFQKQIPELLLDQQIIQIKNRAINKLNNKSDIVIFFNQYKKNPIHLPNFTFLDTIILNNGQIQYIVYYQKNKLHLTKNCSSLKNFVLKKKKQNDLQYQKKKYMRYHMNFSFTQLDHQSQKLIKDFENKIKFISPLLNRIVIVKIKNKQQQQILNLTQFINLFQKAKHKSYDLSHIQYMQIFPIMAGQQEQSYIKNIKYFRQNQFTKPNFKLAQHFFSTWYCKNQTQDKMQIQILEKIKQSEDNLLFYYTYKILIHFQYISNIRIQSACIQFITIDGGKSFFFKTITHINSKNLLKLEDLKSQLPTLKNIDPDDYIDIRSEMIKQFNQYQLQYFRLDKQRKQRQEKAENDKKYSNQVYQTITKINDQNLHDILLSPSKQLKMKYLKLQ